MFGAGDQTNPRPILPAPIVPEQQRVLVVEDDQTIRDLLTEVLSDAGYEVRTAGNGVHALRVLDDWRPDPIMLDLYMPEMDGWTFRDRQLAHADLARVPVVILSASPDVAKEARRIAPDAAIRKPFDVNQVLETVGLVLDGAGGRV